MRQPKTIKLLILMALAMCLLMGAVASADSSTWVPEGNPGEDNSWIPDNYTTLKKAPASRIICELPKGLVADVTITDGAIDVLIDAEKTNWEMALAYGFQSSSGQVYLSRIIKQPDSTARQRCMGYSVDYGNPEQRLIASLQNDYQLYGANFGDAFQTYRIARYEESSGLLQPIEQADRPHGMITLWYDDNGNMLSGEYVLTTIRFTNLNALTVHLPKTAASSITPLAGESANDAALFSVRKENGFIRYEVTQNDRLEDYNVSTAIAAPQIDGKDTSRWTCYYKFGHDHQVYPCEMYDAGQFGLNTRSAILQRPLYSYDHTQQETFTLEWRDEQGVTQQISQLTISTVCGAPAPWLAYAPGWQPVPKNRAFLAYVDPIEPGTSLTYSGETGIAHLHIDPEKLPESADYGSARYFIHFTAPEGATAYSYTGGNTDNGYGEYSYLFEKTSNLLSTRRRELYEEDSEGISLFSRTVHLFETYHQEGRDLTVFMSAAMPGEFAVEYCVINWYRDINDAEPMLTEYVIFEMDDCIMQHISTPLESEDALPEKLTVPAIVIPNDNSAKEMQFVAELYPQESDNARYYELSLLDKNGKMARLPAHCKIYLPYPEGVTADNLEIKFSLRHLNSAHQTIETFSEENGRLHRSPEGLWFSPASLSPFILEWTGGAHNHKLSQDVDPDNPEILVQYCRTCDHVATARLQIADKAADGMPIAAQILYSDNWIGDKNLSIVYGTLDENGNVIDMTDTAPTEPGSYFAFLDGSYVGTADVYFTILPALPVQLPATGDSSRPFAALAALTAASAALYLQLKRRKI